jgi:hypothetical protein
VFVTLEGILVCERWFTDYQEAGDFAADLIHDYNTPGDPAAS